MNRLISIALTVVLFFTACGGEKKSKRDHSNSENEGQMTSPFQAPRRDEMSLGPEYDHLLFNLQVLEITHCNMSGLFAADKAKKIVSVRVKLKNKGEKALYIQPLAMTIEDGDERFRATLVGCQPSLASGYLEAQLESIGAVSFEIPKSLSPPWLLHYTPFIVGSPAIDAVIQLEKVKK